MKLIKSIKLITIVLMTFILGLFILWLITDSVYVLLTAAIETILAILFLIISIILLWKNKAELIPNRKSFILTGVLMLFGVVMHFSFFLGTDYIMSSEHRRINKLNTCEQGSNEAKEQIKLEEYSLIIGGFAPDIEFAESIKKDFNINPIIVGCVFKGGWECYNNTMINAIKEKYGQNALQQNKSMNSR